MNLQKITLRKKTVPIPRLPQMENDFGLLDIAELALKVGGASAIGGPAGGALALALEVAGKPSTRNVVGVLRDVVGVATDIADLGNETAQTLSVAGMRSELGAIKDKQTEANSQLKRIADEMKPLREAVENFGKRWAVTLTLTDQRARQEVLELETKGREAGGKVQYGFRLGQFMWVSKGVPVGPSHPIIGLRHTFICPFPNVQTFAVSIPPGVKWSYTLARWKPPMP